jgi:hypothetical protein
VPGQRARLTWAAAGLPSGAQDKVLSLTATWWAVAESEVCGRVAGGGVRT